MRHECVRKVERVMDRLRDESHQSLGLYLRANFVTQSASMALFFKRAATARLSSLGGVGAD